MTHTLPSKKIEEFNTILYNYYSSHKRNLPWRIKSRRPYHIFISEVMLQQTQVDRVIPKYKLFIKEFSNFSVLAQAPQSAVIKAWQGLGYNRRARFLHQSAKIICETCHSRLPRDPDVLVKLPGIGEATAASICAFAFNMPTLFIETNIRAVFIHHFFQDQQDVPDSSILNVIAMIIDKNNPFDWYSALMDYGVYLKKKYGNPSRKSKHHYKQSAFNGSDRQIRGAILRYLSHKEVSTEKELFSSIKYDTIRCKRILSSLIAEQFISKRNNTIMLQQ